MRPRPPCEPSLAQGSGLSAKYTSLGARHRPGASECAPGIPRCQERRRSFCKSGSISAEAGAHFSPDVRIWHSQAVGVITIFLTCCRPVRHRLMSECSPGVTRECVASSSPTGSVAAPSNASSPTWAQGPTGATPRRAANDEATSHRGRFRHHDRVCPAGAGRSQWASQCECPIGSTCARCSSRPP